MNFWTYKHSHSWFSILLAIGTIAVLLIIVTSLAIAYIRESKLSRFSYNEVIASTAAEWAFEYGMLKVRNHRDGFQDIVTPGEPDGKLLVASTPRSAWLKTEYRILTSSTDHEFIIWVWQHLIIPLFSSNEWVITLGWIQSKNPTYNTGVINSTGLTLSGVWDLSWSIIAMSGSENIAITGTGNISTTTSGLIRLKSSQCYSGSGSDAGDKIDCSTMDLASNDEEIVYSYDESTTVENFLSTKRDPYYILYNGSTTSLTLHFTTTSAFSLPTVTLTATATIGDSSQLFQFTEDKWKYYDALKYGIYNNP